MRNFEKGKVTVAGEERPKTDERANPEGGSEKKKGKVSEKWCRRGIRKE